MDKNVEFLRIVKEQHDYLMKGGTSYRKTTARTSLSIAMKVGKVQPFLTLEESKKTVMENGPFLPSDKLIDVSKFLYTIGSYVTREERIPQEAIAYAKKRKEDRRKANCNRQT